MTRNSEGLIIGGVATGSPRLTIAGGGQAHHTTVENAALEIWRNASDLAGGASYNSRKTNEIWLLGKKYKSGTLDSVGLAREIPQTG